MSRLSHYLSHLSPSMETGAAEGKVRQSESGQSKWETLGGSVTLPASVLPAPGSSPKLPAV